MTKSWKQREGGVCLTDTDVKYLFEGLLKVVIVLARSPHPYLTEKHALEREKEYTSLIVDTHV